MALLKLNADKCTGCGICLLACSAVKEGVFNPQLASLQVHSRYEKGGLTVEGKFCDLCLDCVEACPTEAITVKDGVLSIDQELCTQCGLCVEACPHGIIHLSPSDKLLLCDQCGGSPQCIIFCPHQAIYKEEEAK
ncbi:MAG: 4Fe-4S dicluster domain-containing protein [Dehalococcoidia bacterium]|nr:MAG: 4Fe-4S dicluster domain-containing protein [Dehalococcoidia bacterium]